VADEVVGEERFTRGRGTIEGVRKREEVELTPEELAEVNAGIEEAERAKGWMASSFSNSFREGTWRDGSS